MVRAGFAALVRDDIEGVLALADEDIELLPLGAALVDGRAYHGHAGVRAWDAERRATWEVEFETSDFHEAGDVVLVDGRIRTKGGASGVKLDTPVSWVIAVRAGKIARVEAFLDRELAEAAWKRRQ